MEVMSIKNGGKALFPAALRFIAPYAFFFMASFKSRASGSEQEVAL